MKDSLERVLNERKQSSIGGNDNIFSQLKQTRDERAKLIFGKRGRGVYNDAALKEVEKLIQKRSHHLEQAILQRAKNEQAVTGALVVTSVLSILLVWFKLKKTVSGKLILGQLGGGSAVNSQQNYI